MAGYVVLGVNSEGMKEILTIEVGENENSRYWLGITLFSFPLATEMFHFTRYNFVKL